MKTWKKVDLLVACVIVVTFVYLGIRFLRKRKAALRAAAAHTDAPVENDAGS